LQLVLSVGSLSLFQTVRVGTGAYPASCLLCITNSFPRLKVAGMCNWPVTAIECQGYEWLELYFSVCLYYLQRDNFTL